MANNSLDLIGQARLLYQQVAALRADGSTEDRLAYFRDAQEFCNFTLLELPHSLALAPTAAAQRDYAVTIARNFLYSAYMVRLWEALATSQDPQLAAIAARSLKETQSHLRHASDWLLRMGDGTAQSHQRMQAALDHLMPYTQEFWVLPPAHAAALQAGVAVDPTALRAAWDAEVAATLQQATLRCPSAQGFVPTGSQRRHSEHLGFLLAEMQCLARAHPEAVW